MNCQNRLFVDARPEAEGRTGIGEEKTGSKTRKTDESGAGVAFKSANKGVKVLKFTLGEVKMLKQVDLLESRVDCLESFCACLWTIL